MLAGSVVPFVFFYCVSPGTLQRGGGINFTALFIPGLISGTIWNIGNICSVYANYGISFAVAQPMLQCALLVSGLLGIFVFKEIKGAAYIITFFFFALVLLAGAGLLGIYGPNA